MHEESTEERLIREHIAEIHKEYIDRLRPLLERLSHIAAMKARPPLVVPIEQARKAGILKE